MESIVAWSTDRNNVIARGPAYYNRIASRKVAQSAGNGVEAEMQIVPFTSERASETASLISRALRAGNVQDYGTDRIERIEREHSAAALLQLAEKRDILLALSGGLVLGTASLQRKWIYAVFVDPRHHGQGVGRALLQELERIAGQRGIQRLGVYSSRSGVGFYQQLGFTVEVAIDSEEHGPLTEMSKLLSARRSEVGNCETPS